MSLKPAFCGATQLNIEETTKINFMLIKYSKENFLHSQTHFNAKT